MKKIFILLILLSLIVASPNLYDIFIHDGKINEWSYYGIGIFVGGFLNMAYFGMR